MASLFTASAPTAPAIKEEEALPPPSEHDPPPATSSSQPSSKLQGEGSSGLAKEEGGSSTCGAAPNGYTVVELQQRAALMFTSGEGVVEPSGEPPVAASNNELLLFASLAIHTLFEQRRADVERGCGSLNKEIALGFLVADALGCSISVDQAREIGKRAGKQVSSVKSKIEKLKDRARGKRSAARKSAQKEPALEATLVLRIAEIDAELDAARSKLLKQPYDVGLPGDDEEMNEPACEVASPMQMLAKAKAASLVADAAIEPAELALAAARRKAMKAMDGTERAAELLKSAGIMCSDAQYKRLLGLLNEREALQVELIAEAEAAERVRDLTVEKAVLLRTELLATQRAFEEIKSARDSADAAVRQLERNERALSSAQKIARGLQEIVDGKQCTITALEEAIHALEVRDSRKRLEADAERVWGAGWRDR